jgi:hypothetical protein
MGFDKKVDLHCKFLFGELCQGETGVPEGLPFPRYAPKHSYQFLEVGDPSQNI